METKSVLYDLRTKNGLSQDELAGKIFVTRQAVSRWFALVMDVQRDKLGQQGDEYVDVVNLKEAGIIDISQGKSGITLAKRLDDITFYDIYGIDEVSCRR